jgi:hypothetical protein
MAQQHQKGARAAIVGAHRGGLQFVQAARDSIQHMGAIDVLDPKPGRAAALANVVRQIAPVRTTAHEADGRDAPRQLAEDAVIVGTVDTADATRSLIDNRRENQTVVAQLVGRTPGAVMTAHRLGISAVVHDPRSQLQASLLFRGFASISQDASSRVLTNSGDVLTGTILGSLRRTVSHQSATYFSDVLRGQSVAHSPLTFFTTSGQPVPLAVRPSDLGSFRRDAAHAIQLLDEFDTEFVGVIAAVALVSLEAGAMDVLFVSRSRTDRRRVERVLPFRRPANPFERATIFTD